MSKLTNKQVNNNTLNFVYVECSPGHFGLHCKEICSGHCINNELCDHVYGLCTRGCMDGYIGGHCNICKICTELHKKHVLLLKFMHINVLYNHLKDAKL